MGKFDAAKMNGAQDEKFKNAYNYLIDLLATGYVVESMIDGHRVRISIDTKNGLTITRDGVQLLGLDTVTGRVSVLGTASAEAAAALEGLIDALDDAAVKLGVTYSGAAMSALSGFTSTAVIDGQTVVVNMSSAAGGLSITVDGVQVGGLFLVDGVPSLFAGTLANVIDSPVFAKIGAIEVGGTAHNGLVIYQKIDDVDTAMLGLLFDATGGVSLGDATWRRFDATAADGSIIRDEHGTNRFVADDDGTRLYDASGQLISGGSGTPLDSYPIDSVYSTVSSDDPSVYFGGTWQLIKSEFIDGTVFDIHALPHMVLYSDSLETFSTEIPVGTKEAYWTTTIDGSPVMTLTTDEEAGTWFVTAQSGMTFSNTSPLPYWGNPNPNDYGPWAKIGPNGMSATLGRYIYYGDRNRTIYSWQRIA